MNLFELSDDLIHSKARAAAHDERKATLVFLEFLAEVDRRRLYNARGFSSLWEYVHKELDYSEAQAYERVAAMRLMRRVPEVREKVAENKLTLTSTAKLAAFVRRERCGLQETAVLAEEISGKPTREVERILAAAQTIPERRADRLRPSGPENTRVSFDADSELIELLEELKNRQGRPEWSLNTRLKVVLRAALRAPEVKAPRSELTKEEPKAVHSEGLTTKPTTSIPRTGKTPRSASRYIPVAARDAIRARSGGQCEYVDVNTGRRCASRFDLEFDHIVPYAYGGRSTIENLRHLCASHNYWEAIRFFGAAKVPGAAQNMRP